MSCTLAHHAGVRGQVTGLRGQCLLIPASSRRYPGQVADGLSDRGEVVFPYASLDTCLHARWEDGAALQGSENYQSIAELGYAEPCRANYLGGEVVAERLQLLEYRYRQVAVMYVGGDCRNVLHDEVARLQLAHVVCKCPEGEVPIVIGIPWSALRYPLAHGSAEDHIYLPDLLAYGGCVNFPNVFDPCPCPRVVDLECVCCRFVYLNCSYDLAKAGPLESSAKASSSRKEVHCPQSTIWNRRGIRRGFRTSPTWLRGFHGTLTIVVELSRHKLWQCPDGLARARRSYWVLVQPQDMPLDRGGDVRHTRIRRCVEPHLMAWEIGC